MFMNKKWFSSAAIKSSGYEKIADFIIKEENLTNEILNNIDLLFVKDTSEFFLKKRGNFYTIVTDRYVAIEDQERFILEHPGNFFLSRVGHDIINLISPLEHYEYIEHELLINRVHSGNRFGKQINFIGHLLQKTTKVPVEEISYPELLDNTLALCRKHGIDVEVDRISGFSPVLKNKFLLLRTVEEIVSNWKEHGTGDFILKIEKQTLTFSNKIKKPLKVERPKAQLRCPFMQKNTGKGHGLGLYIVSIASSKGDFDWNIFTDENYFSILLSFS